MKKLIVLFCVLLLVGCKSKEEKALALIKEEMFKTLYDYDSYQPVDTQIDSAYTSIYRDSIIYEYAIRFVALQGLADESIKEAKENTKYAEIYADSYYTRSSFEKYIKQAIDELDKLEFYISKMDSCTDTISLLVKEFSPEFIGWEVKHKFRCKSKGGQALLENYIFIMDEKMTEITHIEDTEDKKIIQIREAIDKAVSEEKKEVGKEEQSSI